jgi:DNA-binding beta-propeller fold protein YncE
VCAGNVCAVATCSDGVKNGKETDLDCGGGDCSPCGNSKTCQVASDCALGECVNGKCPPPFAGILVSDESANKTYLFDPAGNVTLTLSNAGLISPEVPAVGPDGNIYVASFGGSSVLRFSPTGAFIDTFVAAGSGGLGNAVGVAFGPDGNLYVSSRTPARIQKHDGTTGAFLGVFASGNGLALPDTMLFSPEGLFVASRGSDQVLLFDNKTGAFLRVAATGNQLSVPECMYRDPTGRLYVVNRGQGRVDRYDSKTGAFLDTFASGFPMPVCLVHGNDGNFYLSDFNAHTITRLKPDGSSGGIFVPAGKLVGPTFMSIR